MGFNTTLVILNDALHEIMQDPFFGARVGVATTAFCAAAIVPDNHSIDVGVVANAAMVVANHHADDRHLILTGGNRGVDLGYVGSWRLDEETDEGKIAILQGLADRFGIDIAVRKK